MAALFVIHFNWSTHNGERGLTESEFHPVNLNEGYYRVGNHVFNGIYMHANHHLRPYLFNPAKWSGEASVALRGKNEPEPGNVERAA